jgi:site-specific DNA recombinase
MEVKVMTTTSFDSDLRTALEKTGGNGSTRLHSPRRMRAIGYVRQGFDEMDEKATSPEGQKARIAASADTNGWHLLHIYEDIGWSGQDLDRPSLPTLLSGLGYEVLIVDRTDRLTTKKKDLDFLLALLEKHGITCVPATWSWSHWPSTCAGGIAGGPTPSTPSWTQPLPAARRAPPRVRHP